MRAMNISRQEGMTMWSISGLVLIAIFFLLLAFKLIPAYMDDLKIGSVIKRVANQPGAGSKSSPQLITSLEKGFDIEYISDGRIIKEVEILPRGANAKLISLAYEVEIPIVGNISVLLIFDHEYEAR